MRAIGRSSEILVCDVAETFHEFVLRYLASKVDRAWLHAERKKLLVTPHPLAAWVNEYFVLRKSGQPDPASADAYKATLTGNTRALMSLAWDFYTVAHCAGRLLPRMLKRLKHPQEFQGARYEIAVAAIALRAGFKIEWLHGDDKKHVEFKGTHRFTREVVAFEAKTHTREGILAKSGTFDPGAVRVKLLDHIKAAVSQAPTDLPLVLFDDLNFPLSPDIADLEKPWFKSFGESLRKHGATMDELGIGSPLVATFMTNFSWHFLGTADNTPRENEFDVMIAVEPTGTCKVTPGVLAALQLAVEQYGYVPPRLHEKRA